MRTRVTSALALSLTLLAATGCKASPRDRLQGRWLGESIANVSAADLQKATGWVKGTAIEFQGSKVVVTIPAETPRTGTFKVAKAENDVLTVNFYREGRQSQDEHDEAELQLVGPEELRWRIGGGREVLMGKAKN